MSNDRIQCPNRVTHQFDCNDVFGILIAVAAFDVDDDDGMVMAQPVTIMNIHSNPNKRIPNRLIEPIVVFDLDSLPLIAVQMHVIDAKNENLAICLVYVNAPMQMPLRSLINVNALNMQVSQSPTVIHQPNSAPTQPNHFVVPRLEMNEKFVKKWKK